MIEIKNLKCEKPSHPYDVRVDRTSVLGNPFYMKSELQRDEVCDSYQVWIKNKISEKDVAICSELNRLYKLYKQYGVLNLYCWCAPKMCHAQSIKELIEFASN